MEKSSENNSKVFAISKFGIYEKDDRDNNKKDKKVFIYITRADVVSLVNKANSLLDDIDESNAFGAHFWSLDVSKICRKFLQEISAIFDEFYIDNTNNQNYQLSQRIWLELRGGPKNRISLPNKSRTIYLKDANLRLVMITLIGQLRNTLNFLPNSRYVSAYTTELTEELTKLLEMIPPQVPEQRTIRDRDGRNYNEDDDNESEEEEKFKEITIMKEPFGDQIHMAFEASRNAQRIASTAAIQNRKNQQNQKNQQTHQIDSSKNKNQGWEKVGRGGKGDKRV